MSALKALRSFGTIKTTRSLIARPPVSSAPHAIRPLSCSAKFYQDSKKPRVAEQALHKHDDHHGAFSRTDNTVQIEHPEEVLPEKSYKGRGGMHFKRTLPSFSLDGKTVAITGGARGLGLVMSQACLLSGANVALVDLSKEEGQRQADSMVQHFLSENPGVDEEPVVTSHYCDVADPDSVNATLGEIIAQHGKLDHLVTSAGFTENFDAIAYPPDRLKKLMDVDFNGTYYWACAVAKHLMERKVNGSMILIGSMSGAIVNVPQPQAPYNAAKAAVRHLSSSLAVEWAHAGIRVNTISPGYMLTALTEKILTENPELYKHWTSLIPVGKMGKPEDLMGAVVYLLSEASGYVTGAELRVDGGYTVT